MFARLPRLDAGVRQAYLDRLGVAPEAPSENALRLLVRRHAERVPYETLWIQAGEGWGIDPVESAERIARHGRGGYCYHLNGALGLLLTTLGYTVHAHVGGVHGPEGPSPSSRGNHLVLTVELAPSEANPSGVWYVDTGLGDALHDPLPLVAGPHRQAPFDLTLECSPEGTAWHLVHDPRGGFRGMAWDTAEAALDDFEQQHQRLSTSPESGFVQVPMAERRDATGVDVVRGLVLSRIGDGARSEPVTDRGAWFDALGRLFGLRLDGLQPKARDRLWASAVAAHHRWLEEQQGHPAHA
ncbi:arylamine N-acetyltransferase [Pedococcus sp. NPDC057267]|uniref:arylamine N-acetyltransferase family protein n=1 Tax=Pedococcus sp. NPDC057267 TaxID=3346077 RepID=UPI00363B2F71